jgi:HmuY protein
MSRISPSKSPVSRPRLVLLASAWLATACAGDPSLGGSTEPDAGASSEPRADASDVPSTTFGCSAVRGALLGQVDSPSTAEVRLESAGAPRILYVDASAGGFQNAASYPYVYINLEQGARVNISDLQADASLEWDLAFKRFTIRTNGGDSGSGEGGAVAYEATLDQISSNTVSDAELLTDDFLDDETCEPIAANSSGVEGIATAFSDWYSYDGDTMILTPRSLVYVVRGARSNVLYKLQISDYYAAPGGGSGAASGRFRLAYERLEAVASDESPPSP